MSGLQFMRALLLGFSSRQTSLGIDHSVGCAPARTQHADESLRFAGFARLSLGDRHRILAPVPAVVVRQNWV